MKTMIVAVTLAALFAGGSAGCSSPPPAKPKHGVLPAGTAHLSIAGSDASTTGSVQCAASGSVMTIRTGDNKAGVTAELSNAKRLTVNFVRIRDINGFSGDYDPGLGGEAAVALTDSTYHITGTAFGFQGEAISATTQQFSMAVAC